MKTIKWISRILVAAILIFTLPFYFGYGNPLPFTNPNYSLWENITLTLVPIVLIGLIVGWKYPKIGGFIVTVSLVIVFVLGFITGANLSINLLVPVIPGILYLIYGYKRNVI